MAANFFRAAALLFLIFSTTRALAQEDSTRYIFGLPVSKDDTAQVVQDLEPKNRLTAVAADQLPQKLREVLESEEQYRGWKDSTVYYQNNTGLYLVPIKNDQSITLFGLTENGQPVTYNEIIR